MATKKKPPMAAVFGAVAPSAPRVVVSTNDEPDYDYLVPLRLKDASDTKIRCLITWADYCYWVKDKPIMKDHTFDLLVREYEKRLPDDRAFLDKIGMWSR